MDEDSKSKIYQKGFKSCQEHRTSSPETLRYIKNINNNMDKTQQEIGELKIMMVGVSKMTENNGKILAEVKEDTAKHNGRMTKLEGWKNRATGALIACSFLIPTISGLITYIFINNKNINDTEQDRKLILIEEQIKKFNKDFYE